MKRHGNINNGRHGTSGWLDSFFVLLHVAGAYDQVMLLSQNASYFQQQNFGDAQIAYFTHYPLILAPFWIIAIWGGLAASVLLLLRTRRAYPVALSALVAQAVLVFITFGFLNRWQMFGLWLSLFDIFSESLNAN